MISSRLWSSIQTGFAALKVNPLRTALSALGVIIGVGAMVSVLSLSDGVETAVRTQLAKDGRLQSLRISTISEDVVDGQRIPRAQVDSFAPADGRSLASALGGKASVYMTVAGPGLVASLTKSSSPRAAVISATLANGGERQEMRLDAGKFFTDDDVARAERVAVISRQLADTLIGSGVASSRIVGQSLKFQDSVFRVIGVWVAPTPENSRTSVLRAFVPVTTARYAMAANAPAAISGMTVTAKRIEDLPVLQKQTESWLANRFPEWKNHAVIGSYAEESARVRDNMVIFKILMAAITGVSLVVGGVGIMNVLLASVTERTREIGVRKATGARNKDLLAQFLAESVAIAGMGSVLGTLLGIAVASLVAYIMRAKTMAQVHAGFSFSTLAVAVAAPVIVGIAFGIYPALRAARLSPIEAIRHE